MFLLHGSWIIFIFFSLQSCNGVQVKDEKKFAMLFSTIVLPCHYTTHSTQIPVVQWWYKSYCTDRARDSFTFPESLGVSGSDLGATSHLNCPDKSRTVRIVASGRGSSMTLAEHYKGRDISIINKADLHIGRLQRGDSGVYFCKVVIADDLEGKNEGQVELLVQGVFSAETDEVKTVSVMEGDSVTLNPDLTQIQGINLILWRFGDTGFTIAQVEENEITYDPDERFRGRLKLDHQTGSLTITNIRIKHSGLYKAEIIHNSGTTYRKFTVTVYESPAVIDAFKGEMKSVSVTEGESVTLQTDTETHGDELIAWRFGDEGRLIAKHDLEAKSPPLYDPDERFRDRLKLDHQTGSLTITNTRITDSGVYTVKISSGKQTLYKRFTVTVSALSPAAVAGIVSVVVLLVLSAAAAGVFYHRRKVSELQKETKKISKHLKQLPEISNQLKQLTKTYENELPKISKEELLKISGTLKEMSEISEQEMPKISEHLNQLRTEVTNQETTRSDLERGGEKRCITVHDTAISQATGDDKISIEEQGKRIPIRKNSREDAGVHTPDPTVVTPLLKK